MWTCLESRWHEWGHQRLSHHIISRKLIVDAVTRNVDGSDGKLEASRLQELIHDSIKTVLQIVKITAERLTETGSKLVF